MHLFFPRDLARCTHHWLNTVTTTDTNLKQHQGAIKLDQQIDVFIPTAFSPNGDELNDRFVLFANTAQIQEVISFRVFSRWGTMLHQQENFPPNDPTYGWDGTFGNRRLDPGLYMFTAQFRLTNGVVVDQNGTVLLMR